MYLRLCKSSLSSLSCFLLLDVVSSRNLFVRLNSRLNGRWWKSHVKDERDIPHKNLFSTTNNVAFQRHKYTRQDDVVNMG